MASRTQATTSLRPLPPREFPSSGFEVIDPADKVEEEKLPFYDRREYYPMRIGEVLQDRYQTVAKLGYGTSSTVWLCRDLLTPKYWSLKVHIINTSKHNHELEVYQHLATATVDHPGRKYVRKIEDSFKLTGPNGEHDVFVMVPLGMSLRTFQEMQKDEVFQQDLVTTALDQVLNGIDYLHDAGVTHTDLHSDNLLIAITKDSILSRVEEDEFRKPSARKVVDDTLSIYTSRYMLGGAGDLTICDLGQARIGKTNRGSAMPMQYRAPEIILDMEWGHAVDIWSMGLLAWDLLEHGSLFHVYDQESKEQNDAHHLAVLVALLGPPPPEFLSRSKKTAMYWDKDGNWKGPVPVPADRTLESLARALAGQDREWFLDFMRLVLHWMPEERLSTGQMYLHPWMRGGMDALEAYIREKGINVGDVSGSEAGTA